MAGTRKVSIDAANAFYGGYNWQKTGNGATSVEVDDDPEGFVTLRLHGNAIARRLRSGHGGVEVTSAGWESVTTKERLNALVTVHQQSHTWYLNGVKWEDSGEWTPAEIDSQEAMDAWRVEVGLAKAE